MTQVAVFTRDGRLCYICRRPVVLHLALKYLALATASALPETKLADWSRNCAGKATSSPCERTAKRAWSHSTESLTHLPIFVSAA
jgi:hypothetical protein